MSDLKNDWECAVSKNVIFIYIMSLLKWNKIDCNLATIFVLTRSLAVKEKPIHSWLVLSLQVLIEMINSSDAQTLVQHHESNPLLIEGETVEVDFSTEYFTLR